MNRLIIEVCASLLCAMTTAGLFAGLCVGLVYGHDVPLDDPLTGACALVGAVFGFTMTMIAFRGMRP